MNQAPLGRMVSLVTSPAVDPSCAVAGEMIQGHTGKLIPGAAVDVQDSGTQFQEGDVLFGKLRPYLAKVWRADRPGGAIGDLHVYRPLCSVDSTYLAYLLLSSWFIDQVASASYGTKMPRASWDFIRSVQVHVPPLEEQHAIADFLDRETAQIDLLIEKQTALIERLRERRAATAGQLGSAHIGTGDRLKWFIREVDVRGGSRTDLPLLSVSIDWGVRRRDEVAIQQSASEDLSRYKVANPGDLVLNRMRAFQGALGVAPEVGLVSPDYAVLRVSDIDPRWLGLLLRSAPFVAELTSRIRGIGTVDGANVRTPRVSVRDLANVRTRVPSIAEQQREVQAAVARAAQTDLLIGKAERFIELARERRLALITAAVTGQIDVTRGAGS